MAASTSLPVPFKSNTNKTHRTFDLSSSIHKLRTKATTHFIDSVPFVMDDLSLRIRFRSKEQTERFIPIFVFLQAKDALLPSDRRKVHVTMECGHRTHTFWKYAHQFTVPVTCSWGWPSAYTHSYLTQHPLVHFDIKITRDDGDAIPPTMQTFAQQHEKMHELSQINGDITLIVKLVEGEEDSDVLYSPPRQRRRLNNAEDDDQIVQGLDDNEIKISSVILRSASKVFDRMLDSEMMEGQDKRIEIKARSVDDVKDLTYFMSTNILRNTSNPLNLIVLAHYYEMQRLFRQCARRLVASISVANFVETIHVFDKYQIDEGYETLVQFARRNVVELKKTDGFDKLHHYFRFIVLKQ
eukprot:436000_1